MKEAFDPGHKRVDDPNLAEDMARASDKFRTKEAEYRRLAARQIPNWKRTFVSPRLSDMPHSQLQKAEEHRKLAESKEDEVQIRAEVAGETKNLDRKGVQALIGATYEDLDRVQREMEKFVEKNANERKSFWEHIKENQLELDESAPLTEKTKRFLDLEHQLDEIQIRMEALLEASRSKSR